MTRQVAVSLILYEDLANNTVVITELSDDEKKPSKKIATFTAPAWEEQAYDQSIEYYYEIELGKRRVVWEITLQPESAIPSVDSLQAESLLATPVPIIMTMMGGGAGVSEIRITSIERLQGSIGVVLNIEYPPDFTNNLDIFGIYLR